MAIDYFLVIDGVDGDSTRVGFEGAIEPITWSWGVTAAQARGAGAGSGAGRAGRAEFDELQVVARVGRASPTLVEACVTGRHHRRAVLTGVRTADTPVELVRYELGDVTVTSVEHSELDDEPIEEFALAYRQFTITHTGQRPDGSAGDRTSFSHP